MSKKKWWEGARDRMHDEEVQQTIRDAGLTKKKKSRRKGAE